MDSASHNEEAGLKNPDPAIVPFSEVIKFHGHFCPGITLGYCAARIAIEELRSRRDVNEELVAIVENDACGIDAIQVVTGCTLGKGNLIFRNNGKHVFTFINRATNDAVRISLKDWQIDENPILQALQNKVENGKGTPEDLQVLQRLMQEHVDGILLKSTDRYFDVRHVTPEVPGKARIFNSVKCSKCGEMVAESRARVQNGNFVCIPCLNDYTRGW